MRQRGKLTARGRWQSSAGAPRAKAPTNASARRAGDEALARQAMGWLAAFLPGAPRAVAEPPCLVTRARRFRVPACTALVVHRRWHKGRVECQVERLRRDTSLRHQAASPFFSSAPAFVGVRAGEGGTLGGGGAPSYETTTDTLVISRATWTGKHPAASSGSSKCPRAQFSYASACARPSRDSSRAA